MRTLPRACGRGSESLAPVRNRDDTLDRFQGDGDLYEGNGQVCDPQHFKLATLSN